MPFGHIVLESEFTNSIGILSIITQQAKRQENIHLLEEGDVTASTKTLAVLRFHRECPNAFGRNVCVFEPS